MILHIDMDAFFASVEQLDNPDLVGKCVIVGGLSNRGVVAAASYEARKFGIHSAMPIFQAKQKCPHLIIVPPQRGRYAEVSRRVMAILHQFSPLVEQVSIDEAFMDVSGCERLHGTARQIAGTIKSAVLDEVGLTCSVGVAPSKFLAKIASDMDKPDGLTVIKPEQVRDFIKNLPIGKVSGVGKKARRRLHAMGIVTLGDVHLFPPKIIEERFGKFGLRLLSLASGFDETPVVTHSPTKSISSETTLAENTDSREALARYLLRQAQEVAAQLRKKGFKAKTVTIKLKFADFKQITRSRTRELPTNITTQIYRTAVALLEAQPLLKKVRLIGVGVSSLVPFATPQQRDLFENRNGRNQSWEKVDKALDHINRRFGRETVLRGANSKHDRGGGDKQG
jgi:DNA polymerase-4